MTREGNTNSEGVGIGGGIGAGPEGYSGHVTFYVEVPDVEASLSKAENLGGKRIMGPEQVMGQVELGLFTDPPRDTSSASSSRGSGTPCEERPMRAWLLGSGGWIPTGTRETTCLLARDGARALVVDLGTGARRLVTDPALLDGAERLDVLLTHFHPDHVCGLAYLPALPVRATLWAPAAWLYGTASADLLAGFFVPPASPFSPEGMPDVEELAGGRQTIGGWEVTARAQPLHGATTAGFRIGDALAFVTDTAFDEGSAELARGVDHLVHEAWATDPADPAEGHSSGLDAARVAAAAGVRRLTLIHLSPFLESHDPILAEARQAFPATSLGEDGAELLAD